MRRLWRAQTDFQQTTERNLLTSLVLYESLTTTKPRAKLLVAKANSFMNKVRSGDLSAKRLAGKELLDKKAAEKVFEEILPRYGGKETTFCRSVQAPPRRGDNAPMTMVCLTHLVSTKGQQDGK